MAGISQARACCVVSRRRQHQPDACVAAITAYPPVPPFLPQYCMWKSRATGYRIREDDMTRVQQLSRHRPDAGRFHIRMADGGAYPAPYADSAGVAGKTRAQVVAELQEAQRLGLMTHVEGDFVSLQVTGNAGETVADQRASRTRSVPKPRKRQDSAAEERRGGSLVATPQQQEMIAAGRPPHDVALWPGRRTRGAQRPGSFTGVHASDRPAQAPASRLSLGSGRLRP